MKTKNHKPFAIFILSIFVLFVAVAILILAVDGKKVEAPVPAASAPVTNENAVGIAPTMVSIAEPSSIYAITGSYPQFTQADVDFNKKIADGINADVASFTTDASADYKAHLETGGNDFQKEFAKGEYYDFSVTTDVVQSNANFISVIIREEGFTGGAHGFHNLLTFNYDVKNQKEIDLSYFYPNDPNYLAEVSTAARTQLATKLAAAAEETTLDDNTESMMEQGTDPSDPDNFSMFTFTGNPSTGSGQVTVYFGEYQVAPYVYGEQNVVIER